MLETALLLAFTLGLLFTGASLALGAVHGHVELPGGLPHGHVELSGGAAHGHAELSDGAPHDRGSDLVGFNLSALMAGSMWFGGAGYVALKFLLLPVAAVLAVGAVAGAFAYVALAKLMGFLRASEHPMRAEDYELAGTLARVTVPAAAGGVGEIVFTLNGVQRVEGCREAGGGALGKGVEVVITGTARGLALVEASESYMKALEP